MKAPKRKATQPLTPVLEATPGPEEVDVFTQDSDQEDTPITVSQQVNVTVTTVAILSSSPATLLDAWKKSKPKQSCDSTPKSQASDRDAIAKLDESGSAVDQECMQRLAIEEALAKRDLLPGITKDEHRSEFSTRTTMPCARFKTTSS